MTATIEEPRLRAVGHPHADDFDDFIDGLLLQRVGNHIRPLLEVIEPGPEDEHEGIPWEYGSDVYAYAAADVYLPQPPRCVARWEAELHGVQTDPPCPCGCGLTMRQTMTQTLVDIEAGPSTFWFITRPPADVRAPTLAEVRDGVRSTVFAERLRELGRQLPTVQTFQSFARAALDAETSAARLEAALQVRQGVRDDLGDLAERAAALASGYGATPQDFQRYWLDRLTRSQPDLERDDHGRPSLAAIRQQRSSGPPVDGVREARRRHGRRP